MIRFGCPSCKTVLQAAKTQGGAIIACPKCQQKLRVPVPVAVLVKAESPPIPIPIPAVGETPPAYAGGSLQKIAAPSPPLAPLPPAVPEPAPAVVAEPQPPPMAVFLDPSNSP